MNYEVIEISEIDKFEKIAGEWNNLLSSSQSNMPFLRHEWFMNWWEHFGGKNRLSIIVVRKNSELVLILPLMEVRTKFGGLPFIVLQSLTNRHSFRYHFILSPGEENAIDLAMKYLKNRPRRWDLLQIEEVPSDAPLTEAVIDFSRKNGLTSESWIAYDSPYISINCSWDEYFSSLKSKFRSNLRNRTKRLGQIGNVTNESISEREKIESTLTEMFDIESRSWKGEKGSAISCDPNLVSFYTKWANIAVDNKWLRLSLLKVKEQSVAVDYSLVYENRLYCMKIGYDPEFRPYSVGQILCSEIIRGCFESNMAEYDFLGEISEQKSDWLPSLRQHVWLFTYSGTYLSKFHYIYKFLLKQNIKKRFKK